MEVLNNGDHKSLYIDRTFLEETPIVMNITTSSEDVRKRLQLIDSLSVSLSVSFNDLVDQCYELVCRLPLPFD